MHPPYPASLHYEVSCSHHLHNCIFFLHIHRKLCVLDLSSFELNEHNEMTLNKVPYNEHRAQGPCHSGPQNSLFFGGITTLVNYGKITVLQNTQLFNQLNIIYAVTYR